MAESDVFVRKDDNKEEEENERSVREGIISSLPKCNGWVNHYHYQYQGFWYKYKVVQSIMFVQDNFKARSTDILLAANIKCGTTWIKALAFAIVNRSKYPKPHIQAHPLLTTNPHKCVPTLELQAIPDNDLSTEIEDQLTPRLIATHLPYTSLPQSVLSSGCRIVCLCRNPKDMLVSLWHFMDKFKHKEIPLISLEEACNSFCRGHSPCGPYWDHVLGYYMASLKWPERIMFLKYEGMHGDTYNHVKRLAEFVGYPFSMEEEANGVVQDIIQLCSFETMSNLEVNKVDDEHSNIKSDAHFRKGEVGDSKNYLTAQMVERLDRITEEKFQGSGLSFDKLQ